MKDVGGIVKTDINGDPAKLHSECDENGCGEKYDVDGSGRIVELEADEAVIVPEAFEDKCFNDSFCKKPNYYEITGTIKQIASAINVLGGGINFAKGAKVKKNGRKMNLPRLTGQNKTNSVSSRIIDSGSVVINRTNMNNPKVMTFKGTLYEIASDINSYGDNGVKLTETNNDNPKKKEGGKITSLSELDNEFLSFLFDLSKTCQRLGLVYDPNPANFGRTTESGEWVLYDIENWIPTQPEFDGISEMPIDENFIDPKFNPNYEFISTGQGSGGVVYRDKRTGNVLKITNSPWEVWGSQLILQEQQKWRGRVEGFGVVYSVKNLGFRDIEDVFYSSPRNQWYAIEREWVYVDKAETARIGNVIDDIFMYYRENPDKQQKWTAWKDEKQKDLYKSIENTKSGIISFQNPYYPFVKVGLMKKGGIITWKDKYNKKYGYDDNSSHDLHEISKDTGVSIEGLQQIYNKGIGAFKTNPESVRPNVKSKEQWAMARVYSAVMGGKASEIDSNELKKEKGGSIKIDKNKIYNEWSELVNMSKSELEKFYNSEEGKKAGLKPSEAKKQGIDYGRESARWILKMKDTPKSEWSNDMWKWAKKQISFIKRMSGVEGDLYNDNGEKTRKYLALLIWGNDPEKYARGGLIAPNGKPSNLTPEQYKLVRTKEFKEWFGDWENDAENSSKVVDENGEPLVVYHGTQKHFNIFEREEIGSNYGYDTFGFYFTEDGGQASSYAYLKNNINTNIVLEVFLSIKNPLTKNEIISEIPNIEDIYYLDDEDDEISSITFYDSNRKVIDELANNKDGIILIYDYGFYAVRDSNQIKLADGTNTTFDANNPDIRFEEGGLIAPNGKRSNLTSEQYKLVRTKEFKEWFGDWENDAENSSKVVDENGEPLVVYHSSVQKGDEFESFYTFDPYSKYQIGTHFGNKEQAEANIILSARDMELYYERKPFAYKIYECFLNIKKIKEVKDLHFWTPYRLFKNLFPQEDINSVLLDGEQFKRNVKRFLKYIDGKLDGLVYKNDYEGLGKSYLVFEPNQIKLADGTNTTFDGNNPDIRFAKGGSIVGDKKNRPFKVRFHLGRGKNFMHWKIEEKNKPDIYEDPEEVQLIMYNCKLTNQPTTAQKIYSGKINKAPIAYIQCEEVAILPTDVEDIEESNQLRYNPRVNPYWTDTDNDNVDNYYFNKIVSKGSKVYFEEDGQLFYLGGLVEELNPSSESEKEKRYIWEMDGYLWAKNDEDARKIATEIQSNLDFDLRPKINHLYEDFGRGMTRKLFADGGSISATDKIDLEDLELRIQKLRSSTENFKHKAGEILLMDSLTPEQRLEQRFELIDWIKDDKNDVKIIVAFSGGKDSVAMVLHMIYELNIPKEKLQLWHHEVDGRGNDLFDWKCTTSYCKAFAKALDLPILFSYRDGGIERYIFRTNEPKPYVYFQKKEGGEFFQAPRNEKKLNTIKAFPAVGNSLDTRWCSAIAKIEVMLQSINNIDEFKDANLVICTGERRLESANRANYLEIDRYKSMTHTRQSIQWRPVIDFSEKTIWDLFKQYKIQPHPAYEIGFGRCSCQLCIFNSADIWKLNDEISPEKVQRIAEIEKEKGFTLYNEEFKEEKWIPAHSKMTKSGQMRSYKGKFKMVGTGKKKNIYESKVNVGKSPIDIKKEEFRYWIKQATGEFTAPIIVKEWKQPKGAFSSENCGAS